jgi:D-alanine-D-alanine ligase-like ATP-grasp enzyme
MTQYQTATEAMPDFTTRQWFDNYSKVRDASFSMSSGYINALTALMIGLDVTYYRTQKSAGTQASHFAQRFRRLEFYSVTSPTTAHYFWSSASIVSSALSAARVTQNKALAKPVLAKAGVRTPAGGPANAANMTVLDQLQAARVTRVVVKPTKGSAARGVAANVTLDEARAYIRFKPNEMFVVEQYINGTEVRATMVGGLLCSAVQREPCFVVGDGFAAIEDLVSRKVDSFSQNPRAAVQKYKLSDFASYLRQQGRSFADVPAIGERVRLRGAHPVTGDERNDVTATVHRDVVVQATNAIRAFQLGVGAVDTITSASGQTFVLELNAKPSIDLTVFPNNAPPNLRVPEAIMRWHFPQHQAPIRRVKRFDFLQLWKDYETQLDRDEFNARDYVDLE